MTWMLTATGARIDLRQGAAIDHAGLVYYGPRLRFAGAGAFLKAVLAAQAHDALAPLGRAA